MRGNFDISLECDECKTIVGFGDDFSETNNFLCSRCIRSRQVLRYQKFVNDITKCCELLDRNFDEQVPFSLLVERDLGEIPFKKYTKFRIFFEPLTVGEKC